jgi:hypothetical protein
VLYDRRFRGFNSHPKLEGSHAFLSASNYHWVRDTEEKLLERLRTSQAAALGTELHETAARNIRRKIRVMPHDEYPAFAPYVNDAIDLEMLPEQMLFYSVHAYGTADTIKFEEYNAGDDHSGFLRIHDFKSGTSKASVDQLYVYAAFFCLEYEFRPYEIDGELRIYQGEDVRMYELDRAYLAGIYDRTRDWNKVVGRHLDKQRMGGLA